MKFNPDIEALSAAHIANLRSVIHDPCAGDAVEAELKAWYSSRRREYEAHRDTLDADSAKRAEVQKAINILRLIEGEFSGGASFS
jgi:hypothetical protein